MGSLNHPLKMRGTLMEVLDDAIGLAIFLIERISNAIGLVMFLIECCTCINDNCNDNRAPVFIKCNMYSFFAMYILLHYI